MNRSNASRSKALPVGGPELKELKSSAKEASATKSSSVKSAAAKSTTAKTKAATSREATSPSLQSEQAPHSEHSHGPHSHVHDDESIRLIVNRLSRIEGHVRGLKRMVQDQENCPDVLIQVAAVRGALDKVARLILDEHLTQCVLRAAKEGNIEAEIEELQAALNRFLP